MLSARNISICLFFALLISPLSLAQEQIQELEIHTEQVTAPLRARFERTLARYDLAWEAASASGAAIKLEAVNQGAAVSLQRPQILPSPVLAQHIQIHPEQPLLILPRHGIWPDSLLGGLALYASGDCPAAEQVLSQYRTAHQAITAFYRGNCALMQDDMATAEAHYQAALDAVDRRNFSYAPAINLAWIAIQTGNPDTARNYLEVVMPDPAVDSPRLQIALHQHRAGLLALLFDYGAAITEMDQAIALAPEDATLLNQRGQYVLLTYEWNRALEDFNAALELDPDYADTYYWRGLLFYTMAERDAAANDFQAYLDRAPSGDYAKPAEVYLNNIAAEIETLGE